MSNESKDDLTQDQGRSNEDDRDQDYHDGDQFNQITERSYEDSPSKINKDDITDGVKDHARNASDLSILVQDRAVVNST